MDIDMRDEIAMIIAKEIDGVNDLNFMGDLYRGVADQILALLSKQCEPASKKEKTMWTKEEIWEHLKLNLTDKAGSYSAVVVVAALYKKLYGEFPKIGLSGAQAEYADSIIPKLPDSFKEKEFDHTSMDAVVWAKEFVRIFNTKSIDWIDESLMVGWFANAIMAGYDEGQRRIEKQCEPKMSEEEIEKIMKNELDKYGLVIVAVNDGEESGCGLLAHALAGKIAKPQEGLHITCDFCNKNLEEFGANLYGVPDKDMMCKKKHLCKSCYDNSRYGTKKSECKHDGDKTGGSDSPTICCKCGEELFGKPQDICPKCGCEKSLRNCPECGMEQPEEKKECEHSWACDGINSYSAFYHCRKCGKTKTEGNSPNPIQKPIELESLQEGGVMDCNFWNRQLFTIVRNQKKIYEAIRSWNGKGE